MLLTWAPCRLPSAPFPPAPCRRPRRRGGPLRQRYEWLVITDFHITPCVREEVGALYGGQKVPCLLFYSRVRRAALGGAAV